MKKNLLLLVIAIMCFSARSYCQTEKTIAPLTCTTDCFFTDCTVTCPPSTTPKCRCILGSFGSCGCQPINTNTKQGGSDQLPNPKNQTTFPKVVDQLNKAGYNAYADNFSALYSALSAKDAAAYQKNFAALDAMVAADPATADLVQNIVAGNFR